MAKLTLLKPDHADLIRKALSNGFVYMHRNAPIFEHCVSERWLALQEGGRFYPTIIGKAALEAYDALGSSVALKALQQVLADHPVATRPSLQSQMFGE